MSVQRVRRLDLPWVSLGIFVAWAALVVIVHFASQRRDDAPTLCHFKNLTGIPCPTCGGTRAAFSLAHLHPVEAISYNPLLTIVMVGACGYLSLRTLTGRGMRIEWTRRARVIAWTLFACAFVGNWAWVIHRLG
ncbi:MAG: DUF2752 domain-containing protein [Phycisphaerales bacterium]